MYSSKKNKKKQQPSPIKSQFLKTYIQEVILNNKNNSTKINVFMDSVVFCGLVASFQSGKCQPVW